jgi:phospholipid-translocating ATPase
VPPDTHEKNTKTTGDEKAHRRLDTAMRLEEMPLRLSSDERDFEMDDEETDYLLQPSEDSIRQLTSRRRRITDCSKYLKNCLCG